MGQDGQPSDDLQMLKLFGIQWVSDPFQASAKCPKQRLGAAVTLKRTWTVWSAV